MKISVIIGSTRQGRFCEKPARWILDEIKKKKQDAELLDLRDYPMPFYDEAKTPKMLNGNYPHKTVQKWADKIKEADAFVIVTPEYNHGYPAVLKNALDSVFIEWNKKPVGFVSYGSALGARSVEQLRQVVIELQMFPISISITISSEVYMKVMNENIPVNPELFAPARKSFSGDKVDNFIDELISAAKAMKELRKKD